MQALRVPDASSIRKAFGFVSNHVRSIINNQLGLALSSMVLVLLFLFLRAPDVFLSPQLWAEDGSIFTTGAVMRGFGSLFVSYAGYLHLVPRLVALSATRFSAVETPAIYAYCAIAITLWSAATIACSRAPAALALAVLIVLVPGGYEIFGTITNVQWFMQTALLIIVASPRPSERTQRCNQVGFAAMSSLSGPFSILLSPLSAYRLVFGERTLHDRLICSIVLCSAAIQLCMLGAFGDDQATTTYRPAHLFWVMLGQSIEPGSPTSASHIDSAPLKVLLITSTVFLALRCERRFVAAISVYLIINFASIWVRHLHNGDNIFYGFGERYFYFPRLYILWCSCVVLSRAPLPQVSRSAMIAALTLLAILGTSLPWRRPPLKILPWRSLASRIDDGQAVTIVVNPSTGSTPLESQWRIELPARR